MARKQNDKRSKRNEKRWREENRRKFLRPGSETLEPRLLMFKPSTHIEIAIDTRRDLIEDGKVTIESREYDVHPRVVEAIKKYPDYYYGGAVGPDGFPDIVMGQAVIHPDSTGVWISHVFDQAWAAQQSNSYSPEEKLQILAWSYGFATHSAGDLWAHTLVNEFTDGTFPEFTNVVSNEGSAANPIRHFIVEAYVGDATPGFDGIGEVDCDLASAGPECTDEASQPHGYVDNVERTRLPDGDVSNDTTPRQAIKAPHQFVYDALINNLPDLPGHKEIFLFQSVECQPADVPNYCNDLITTGISNNIQALFQANGISLRNTATLSNVVANQVWTLKNDYAYYTLRVVPGFDAFQNPITVLKVFENSKSRGAILDRFISLRGQLLAVQAELQADPNTPPIDPNYGEPFADVVDLMLDNLQRFVRGDETFDAEQFFDDLKDLAEDFGDQIRTIYDAIAADDDFTSADLATLAAVIGGEANNYLQYWIQNIDSGLAHWSELGQATSRALFDPQSKRDLQYKESQGHAPDAVDVDFIDDRGDEESEVGLLDVITDELDDPNDNRLTEDSFINNHLLPMLGIPRKIAQLRGVVYDAFTELKEKFLEPTQQLLGDINPIEPLTDWIVEQIKEWVEGIVAGIVKEKFGVDIYVVDFLLSGPLASRMDLKSLDLGDLGSFEVMRSTDHELLDSYLGIGNQNKDHLKPFRCFSEVDPASCLLPSQTVTLESGESIGVAYHPDARGELKENVEFDKEKFAPYANSVTTAKLLLLQENLVGEAPVAGNQPRTISKLLTDLIDQPGQFYDFTQMTLNGNHGGNLLTATMPGAVDSQGNLVASSNFYPQPMSGDMWLTLIDAGQTWRQDSQTRTTELYHYHATGAGNNSARWTFNNVVPGTTYQIQVDWLLNNAITDQGWILPASNATYTVSSLNQSQAFAVDQNQFPDDVVVDGKGFRILGNFTVPAGATSLTVTLSDAGMGEFVVAGRARIEPLGNPAGAQLVTNKDPGYSETSGLVPSSGAAPVFSWVSGNGNIAAAQLNTAALPQGLLDVFAAQDISSSYFVSSDVTLGLLIDLVDITNLVSLNVLAGILAPFGASIQNAITAAQNGDTDPLFNLKQSLVDALNAFISGPSIFNPLFFNDVVLSPETNTLLGPPTPAGGERVLRLNRLLLEDAYPESLNRSLPNGFAISTVNNGQSWRVTRQEKYDRLASNPLRLSASDKVAYFETYTIVRSNNTFNVFEDWQGIQYRTGSGNMPLWESSALRPVFRTLFKDWQNGAENFPALGDAATPDANLTANPIVFGAFPSYQPFVPVLIAPVAGDLVVSGNMTLQLVGDQVFNNIVGDGDATPDNLHLIVSSGVTITGFVGGRGLKNVTIEAVKNIDIADGATISTRQVAPGANHWNAPSQADSGNIILAAPRVRVGQEANLLAHATNPHAAGNVTISAIQDLDQIWSFLTIEGFKWIETEAIVDIAMEARIMGYDISIGSESSTKKKAVLDRSFSVATRGTALGDIDGNDDPDLIVVTDKQGILRYEYNATDFTEPTVIDNGLFTSTSVALADIDNDQDLDLVVGNREELNRLYLNNNGALTFAGTIDTVVRKTSSVVLANLDADPALELIVGTDQEGLRLYQFNGTSFLAPTVIDAATNNTTSLSVGDADADGDLDLVAGNFGQSSRLYLNQGGSFLSGVGFGNATQKTTAVAMANVDADANAELIMGTDGQGLIKLDFGGGTFGSPTILDSNTFTTKSVAIADLDGDGDNDVVAGNYLRPTRWYRNQSNVLGNGQSLGLFDNRPTFSLAVGQVDGEPGLEIITGNDRRPNRMYKWETIEGRGGYRFGDDISVDGQLVSDVTINDPVPLNTETGVAVVAESTSHIVVGEGALIRASHDVMLDAQASSQSDITTIKTGFGITYGNSSPDARIAIDTGATITAVNNVHLLSHVDNTLKVRTFVPSVGESTSVSFSFAIGTSNSMTDVKPGATIQAQNVTVKAENTNSFRNVGIATGFGTEDGESGLGATVVLGFYHSLATARASGNITATNLNIEGKSINTDNTTRSFAAVGGGFQDSAATNTQVPLSPREDGLFEDLTSFLEGEIPIEAVIGLVDEGQSFTSEQNTDGYAAAFSLATNDNEARALIGDDASFYISQNLNVHSLAEDPFRISASGNAGALGASKETSIGGALIYAQTANQASSFVGWNADVDVAGTLDVDSQSIVTTTVDPLDLALEILGIGPGTQAEAIGAVYGHAERYSEDTKGVLDDNLPAVLDALDQEDGVGTTFIHTGGVVEDGGMSVGGGIKVFFPYNAATSGIARGARVNQRTPTLPANQDVHVHATSTIDNVNMSGNASVLNYAQDQADTTIGGYFDGIFMQNTAQAYIDDLATVSAGRDLKVEADTEADLVTIAQAGGYAQKVGIEGAIIVDRVKNTTLAYIEDRATIQTGRDLILDAKSDVTATSITPALAIGGEYGVGIGVSVTEVRDKTRAFIADGKEPVPVGGYGGFQGTVHAGNDLVMNAHSNPKLWSVGASAGISPGSDEGGGGGGGSGGSSFGISGTSQTTSVGEGNVGGESGYGLSASVGVTWIEHDTRVFIRDDVVVTVDDELKMDAKAEPHLYSIAGAFGFGEQVGFGGTWAHAQINQNTKAFIENADVTAVATTIQARSINNGLAVAASGSGSTENAAVAGAVPTTVMNNDTLAYVGNNAEMHGTDLAVRAKSQNTLLPIAGAVSIGEDYSVGVNVGLVFVDNRIEAWIGDSNVSNTGNITVTAENKLESIVVGASLSGSTDGIAGGGSAAALDIDQQVRAFIGANANVATNGSIYINANDALTLTAIAGSAAGGDTAGIGLSATVNTTNRVVRAFIAENAVVSAKGQGSGITDPSGSGYGGSGITIDASANDHLVLTAAGGAFGGDAAIAASASVNDFNSTVEAFIANGATVNNVNTGASTNQSVRLRAENETTVIAVAGNFAASSEVGIGAALDTHVIHKTTRAYIAENAVVKAAHSVIATATSNESIISIAAGASFAGTAAISGSASVFDVHLNTQAFVAPNAIVFADGNVKIAADGETSITTVAGNIGYGGSAAIGASNSSVVRHDTMEAYIGTGAQVTALGKRSPVAVLTGQKNSNGNKLTQNVIGVSVTANSWADYVTIAASGQVSSSVGGAGTVVVNDLHDFTRAYISAGALVNQPNAGATTSQSVNVLATDNSSIVSVAGALGGAGTAGVGAGADVGVLEKETLAWIDAGAVVNARDTIRVQALSDEDLTSVAAAIGAGGSAGIAGSAGVSVVDVTTKAFVAASPSAAGGAVVRAEGNVYINADDGFELDVIAGNVVAGGSVGVGASAAVSTVNKTVDAYIGKNAKVTGLGLRSTTLNPKTGEFSISALPDGGTQEFAASNGNSDPAAAVRSQGLEVTAPGAFSGADLSSDTNEDSVSNASLTHQRFANAGRTVMKGVAVTAMNQDDVETIGFSAGAGGTAAVNIGGVIHVLTTSVRAHVDESATVNGQNTGAGSEQDVLVAAGSDYSHLGVVATGSVGGSVGVTPGAHVAVVETETLAYVDDKALIRATGDVSVIASAQEDLLSVAASGAGGGAVGIAGAVTVLTIDTETRAFVGVDATNDAGGATIAAGGTVLVSASDDTKNLVVAGSLGIGIGAAGIGASVSVVTIDKNTEASIGDHAQVDGKGNGANGIAGVYNGNITSAPFATLATFRGVAVQASSSEDVFTIAAAAGAGVYFGLAGGVGVEIINSDTTAFIGEDARINQDSSGTHADQSVNVSAVNDTKVFTFAGGLAGGFVGIGGGVNVGAIRNNTTAYIGSNSDVAAKSDVEVNALSHKDVFTIAVSAAGGVAAAAGSVSVWSLGGAIDGNYEAEQRNEEGASQAPQTDNALADKNPDDGQNASISDSTSHSDSRSGKFTSLLGGYGGGSKEGQITSLAAQRISQKTPGGKAAAALSASGAQAASGTTAYIANGATVLAGDTVAVRAKEKIEFDSIVGSASGGFVGIGGSVSVVNISSDVDAYIGAATVTAGSGAFDDIRVEAEFDEEIDVLAFSGQAGLVGLGAQVAYVRDSSQQAAHIDSGAKLTRAGGTVLVKADADRNIDADAVGGNIGAVAIGVAVAFADVDGSTLAFTGNIDIGQTGQAVKNVDVQANSSAVFDLDTVAVSAGVFGGVSGSIAVANYAPTIEASIGNNSDITVSNQVKVSTNSNVDFFGDAINVNASAGVAIGAGVVVAHTNPNITTKIGSAHVTTGNGDVIVESTHDGTVEVLATSAGIGVLGVGAAGAVAVVDASSNQDTFIASGAVIDSGNGVRVQTNLNNQIDADTTGVGGGATGQGISIALTEIGGQARAHINDATIVADGNVVVKNDVDIDLAADVVAVAGGIVSGQFNLAKTLVNPGIEAFVGNSATVNAGGSVHVQSFSKGDADSISNGVSVGAGFAMGISMADAQVIPSVDSYIGQASVTAGSGITVESYHNFGGSDPTAKGATTKANASGGGIVAANGAISDAVASATLNAHVDNATLNAGGNILVRARGHNDAQSDALARTIGVVGAGATIGDANANGSALASVSGSVQAGGNLTIESELHNVADTLSEAAAAGLAAGVGADADTVVSPTLTAKVSGNVDVDGGVSVGARFSGSSTATTPGLVLGAIGLGATLADARMEPVIMSFVGPSAQITAGQFVTVEALDNVDAAGGLIAGGAVANSTVTGGGIISGQGAFADALHVATLDAYVANGSEIDAGGHVTIRSNAHQAATAVSDGVSLGLGAAAAVHAQADANGSVKAHLDGHIVDGGNVSIVAKSVNLSDAEAMASSGGIVAGSSAVAVANSNPELDAFVANGSTVDVGGNVDVSVLSEASAQADAKGSTFGAISVGASESNATASPNLDAHVGAGANISGHHITIQAVHNYTTGGSPLDRTTKATSNASAGTLLGGSGAVPIAIANPHVESYVAGGANLFPSGNIIVAARSLNDVTADANALSVGLGTVGVSLADADANGATIARLDGDVQGGADLTIVSQATTKARSEADAAGGGLFSAQGAGADANASPTLLARINDNANVLVGGSVNIKTLSRGSADADAYGLSIGAVAVGFISADSRFNPSVTALIGQNSEISAGGEVLVEATNQPVGNLGARSSSDAGGGGFFAGIGAKSESRADGNVEAYIGGGADITAGQTVGVHAGSFNQAKSVTDSLAVGAIEVAGVKAVALAGRKPDNTATYNRAYIGNGAAIVAGGLEVEALGTDEASTSTNASGGGLISVNSSESTAIASPMVAAFVGNSVDIEVLNDAVIRARSNTDADAVAKGETFGGFDVGDSLASATVNPDVKSYLGTNSTIEAGGNVVIEAIHGQQYSPPDDSFSPATAVNTGNDTITLNHHGLTTGTQVQYENSGNPDIGGLSDGREYNVLRLDEHTLQLGVAFDAALVNSTNDLFSFTGPHNLKSGDRVVYNNGGNANIGGLSHGQTYFVRVIDDSTIKLATSESQATAALKTFGASSAVNSATDSITLAGHGFSTGQAVTYRAPKAKSFTPSSVDRADQGDNTIYFGDHDFDTAQELIYEAADGAIGGLVNGTHYFAIKISDGTIRLAASAADANGGTAIALDPATAAAGSKHKLRRVGDVAIPDLVDGGTYYAIAQSPNSFQLALTPQQASANQPINLNASGVTGTHRIGVEGIDVSATTGQHSLRLDLTSKPAGNHKLLGPGGVPLNLVSPPTGDGRASASAKGLSGAFIGIKGTEAKVVSAPSVTAYIADAASPNQGSSILAGGDVTVAGTVFTSLGATANNGAGGFIAAGFSQASGNIGSVNSVFAGDHAHITAAGGVSILASTDHSAETAGKASGGGFIDIAISEAVLNIGYLNTTRVGDSANIEAGETIRVASETSTKALSRAAAHSGGLGSDSEADASLIVGSVTSPAFNISEIGDFAQLRGEIIEVVAIVPESETDAITDAEAAALGANSDANSVLRHTELNQVVIRSQADLVGIEKVELAAGHSQFDTNSDADANCDCGGGDTDADAENDITTKAFITAEGNANLTSQNVYVHAFTTVTQYGLDADASGGFIDFGSADVHGALAAERKLTFNSDILALQPGPEMHVAADGTITTEGTINFALNGNQIQVNDWDNDGASVRFEVDQIINPALGIPFPLGILEGNQSTINFATTFGKALIVNESTKDIVLNNLDPVSESKPVVELIVDVPAFEFDAVRSIQPTVIEVQNLSSSDVLIGGLVENPIGETRLTNLGGTIRSTGPQGILRTNNLIAQAPMESVGTNVQPLFLHLVHNEDQEPSLAITAGQDVFLDLTGRLRDPAVSNFTVQTGEIFAGDDIDLQLQRGVEETVTPLTNVGEEIDVVLPYLGQTTTITTHYPPGGGDPRPAPISGGLLATNPQFIDSTYEFDLLQATGDINIVGHHNHRINILGNTNLLGAGRIDANTDGDINLKEIVGDFRVGLIVSSDGVPTLTAAASIVDALNDSAADVQASSIVLKALGGTIGSSLDDVESIHPIQSQAS